MLEILKNWFFGKQSLASVKNRPARRPALTLEALEARDNPSGYLPSAVYFTATAVSGSQINLNWSGGAGANGYLIDEWRNGAWTQIGNRSSGSTGVGITGLSPNTTYYFEVGAYNTAGTTWAANYQSATTFLLAPAAPSFTATAVSSTQINLAWNSVTGANGYLVDEWVNGAWKQIGSLGSGSTGVSVTGLSPNTTYYFDVGAYNTAGTTWAPTSQSATTPATTLTINHPLAGAAYSPVSGSLFGSNGPTFQDVQQGAVGDCWLLSSLAEVATHDPADIRNMFTSNGTTVENGSVVGIYTVRLFDNSGTPHYLTVDTELPGGGTLYDHPANGVLWVALAEKAYAEANGAGFVTTQHVGSDSYSAMEGGDAMWALRAITGKSASDFSVNPNNIAAAWNAGELIVLCTSNPASPYIVGDHCYAVVGYNPLNSQPFEVYNPWGTNSSGWALGTENGQAVWGLFTATGAFLSQNFTGQSIGVGSENATDNQVKIVPAVADLIFALEHHQHQPWEAGADY